MKKFIFGIGLAVMSLTSMQMPAFWGDGCNVCCEDGPLNCNAFGVLVKGGVTPSHFTHRGRAIIFNPSLEDPIFTGSHRLKFSDLYNTPWQVGVELQWNPSTHVQFFAEYVYEHACGKKREFLGGDLVISQHHQDLETNSFYLGSRYFFGNIFCTECWGTAAPFLGVKGGFKWHERKSYHLYINEFDLDNHNFYKNQPAVSVGAQIGLDWAINCNLGVVLTAEAVLTQGFRTNRVLELPVNDLPGAPTAIGLPDVGRIISYPVTLGVRYTF